MLNFLDQLDEEQALNAEKVAIAARRAGVDPKLAVAIAYQESKLRANAPRGSSGEIGLMQVMPGTGRGMGYTEKQLSNLDDNIEAGIKYLKQGLKATENDPQLAAIYYNGGPGAIQAMMAGKDPDPRVYDYLRSVNSYGTFAAPPKQQAQPASEAQLAPEVQESDAERDARINAAMEAQERRMGQIYGGGVGTGVSLFRLGKESAKDVAQSMAEAAEKGRIAAQARATPPAGGLPTTGAAPAAGPAGGGLSPISQGTQRIMQGTTGDAGTTGLARMRGFNEETSRVSAAEKEAARNIARLQQQGVVSQSAESLMAKAPGLTSTQSGVLYARTPEAETLGPRSPQGQIGVSKPPPKPVAPPGGLQTVTQELRAMAQPIISGAGVMSRYVVPPLALASAGGEGADVYSELRKQDPDYIKAMLSGITGISGLAALAPPLTLPATAIGGSAAIINYLREQQKERERRGIVTEPPPSADYAAP